MEKESNSKVKELQKRIDKQAKDLKKLEKKSQMRMTAMKFVGVIFDPEKFKTGEAQINQALADGFEVIRDFETGGGIVMALGKWEKNDEKVKNEWDK